ncbi:hypothetical protein [Fluviispira multicolorata]|uniref:TolB-like 6-blade propeller-like n=1 Tax=Fluviispira multicolorata TaxID=2654512 RepID=A0A833N333_9BACT|nr:hypothetical protein [Fluviispira multicolorata]KAB8029180.1 hypothetical protein GCL57_11630 [Fluviispira multicolorata]
MRLHFIALFVLCSLLIAACGTKKQNVVPTINVQSDQIMFTTYDYMNKFVKLYSFDFGTKSIKELNHISGSSDSIAFQTNDRFGDIKDFYLVERFSSEKNSRVTHYNKSERQNQYTSFPMNMKDMIFFNDELISIGYDKGEIIKTDLSLKTKLPLTAIKKLEHTPDEASISDKNINSVLIVNERVFLVSVGSYSKDDKGKSDKFPKIYLLNDELTSVEKSWPIQNCFNAASQQRVIDKSKLLLSCDPNYGMKSDYPSLVLINAAAIDISENLLSSNAEKILNSNSFTSPNIYQVSLSGVSKDKKSIFITEYSSYQVVDKSYWLNLENNVVTQVNNVAEHVFYNKKNDSYIFNCYFIDGKCEKDKFVISKYMDGRNPEFVNAKIYGFFTGFPKVLN